jgi:benzil reductase ((S)-benzoin forming)
MVKNNNLAIVTGGSRGLGAALCTKYLELGYHVVSFSRRGTEGHNVTVDLTDPDAAQMVFASSFSILAAGEYDEIVCINNAGVLTPIGPAAQKPVGDVTGNLNVNFVSQILFIRSFMEHFQGHSGKKTLVNISSGAALKGYYGWSLYCATKAGMENFIRALAMEQSREKYPIAAFSIDPHIMDTDMQNSIRRSSLEDFPDRLRFDAYKKEGALMAPSDVADIIIRLINGNPQGGERLSAASYKGA